MRTTSGEVSSCYFRSASFQLIQQTNDELWIKSVSFGVAQENDSKMRRWIEVCPGEKASHRATMPKADGVPFSYEHQAQAVARRCALVSPEHLRLAFE